MKVAGESSGCAKCTWNCRTQRWGWISQWQKKLFMSQPSWRQGSVYEGIQACSNETLMTIPWRLWVADSLSHIQGTLHSTIHAARSFFFQLQICQHFAVCCEMEGLADGLHSPQAEMAGIQLTAKVSFLLHAISCYTPFPQSWPSKMPAGFSTPNPTLFVLLANSLDLLGKNTHNFTDNT